MVRDETQKVAAKVDGHGLHVSNTTSNNRDISRSTSSFSSLLSTPIEDQAIYFFLHNWNLREACDAEHSRAPQSWYQITLDIWQIQPARSPLQHAVLCVAKSGLARHLGIRANEVTHELEYVTALRLTNNALCNASEARADGVLLAAMLLGTYEVSSRSSVNTENNTDFQQISTYRQRQSIRSWTRSWAKHMNGVATLIKLRGEEQFRTQRNVRLFMHARLLCVSVLNYVLQVLLTL